MILLSSYNTLLPSRPLLKSVFIIRRPLLLKREVGKRKTDGSCTCNTDLESSVEPVTTLELSSTRRSIFLEVLRAQTLSVLLRLFVLTSRMWWTKVLNILTSLVLPHNRILICMSIYLVFFSVHYLDLYIPVDWKLFLQFHWLSYVFPMKKVV